ncbi:MAG TPA: MFS transporter [Hanamia sp.]|nr:MFS transporter [Hanamia sp.]
MSQPAEKATLTPKIKYLITIGCGVIVANLYYCQPLLGEFSRSFHVSEESASFVNICSQIGYGLGLFFIVPLGDMLARRGLLIWMHLLAALSLIAFGFSPTISWLYLFSAFVGITSTACQVFIPLAMHLASDEERGKVLGTILGGLLTGILLSRSLSGFVAEYFGWQSVYFISAFFMVIMTFLIWKYIPGEEPSFKGSYLKLMKSLFSLFKEQSVIRESAWIGACLFGAISAFWATMAFFLEKPPYQYSLSVIGLFGIIGAGGALVAPLIGKITDKYGPFKPMQAGIFLMLAGYLILLAGKSGIVLMIIGIILIDMGLQSTHIPNLSRNYSLLPKARTRLNTIYMTFFFIGGTIGSSVGSIAWNKSSWTGVCITGILFILLGAFPIFIRKLITTGSKTVDKK